LMPQRGRRGTGEGKSRGRGEKKEGVLSRSRYLNQQRKGRSSKVKQRLQWAWNIIGDMKEKREEDKDWAVAADKFRGALGICKRGTGLASPSLKGSI